jgi:hypothetical protein
MMFQAAIFDLFLQSINFGTPLIDTGEQLTSRKFPEGSSRYWCAEITRHGSRESVVCGTVVTQKNTIATIFQHPNSSPQQPKPVEFFDEYLVEKQLRILDLVAQGVVPSTACDGGLICNMKIGSSIQDIEMCVYCPSRFVLPPLMNALKQTIVQIASKVASVRLTTAVNSLFDR